jgi:choline dehydrogenase-like flavoprotein
LKLTEEKSLQDHIYFSVVAEANATISYSSLYHNYSKLQQASQEYQESEGPLTAPIGLAFGFEKVSPEQLASIGAKSIAAQNRSGQAHIEYLYETTYFPNVPSPYYSSKEYNTSYVSFTAAILAPISRGTVSIKSNSLADPPQINPQYYSSPEDQALAIYSFKNLRKVLAEFAKYDFTIGPHSGEVAPGPEVQSDDDILNYIRETSIPVWHASGTCAMLPREKGGVVDEKLKVYGVKGLRVVDASVFPIIPDTHTMGTVYMLAEKAAAMIKAEYGS